MGRSERGVVGPAWSIVIAVAVSVVLAAGGCSAEVSSAGLGTARSTPASKATTPTIRAPVTSTTSVPAREGSSSLDDSIVSQLPSVDFSLVDESLESRGSTVNSTTTSEPEPTPSAMAVRLGNLVEPWLARDLDVSVSVGTPTEGVVFEHQPELELYPASNQKLLTAVGAFELLPPDHRFTTTVAGVGSMSDGALHGDLVLVASGDPTLTVAHLHGLAAEVRAAGIETVTGDLVVDASRYDTATMAPGWQDWQMPTYVGPLSTLVVDDNRWRTDDAYVANPTLGNAELFADALTTAGVRVNGVVRSGTDTAGAEAIAAQRSAPISELIVDMLRSSDNEIAESVVREIGHAIRDDGTTTSGLAAIRQTLHAKGFQLSGTDGDGSGLSRHNLRSANSWRQLLTFAQDRPWFDDFLAALPVSGHTGTMAGRLTGPHTSGRVAAKTGTIIGGRSLSGYATLADGDIAVFSIVVNGDASHDARSLIDNLVVEFISSLT